MVSTLINLDASSQSHENSPRNRNSAARGIQGAHIWNHRPLEVQGYPRFKNLSSGCKGLELCVDVVSDVGIKAKSRLLRFLSPGSYIWGGTVGRDHVVAAQWLNCCRFIQRARVRTTAVHLRFLSS